MKALSLTIQNVKVFADKQTDRLGPKKDMSLIYRCWGLKSEKMLIGSIFSLSPNVFKSSISQGHPKCGLYGNGLTLYQTTIF